MNSGPTSANIVTDAYASAFGVGAVLSQIQDGQEKGVAYGSKTLSRSQKGYCTRYRELLAVVIFVKQFRHYLYDRPFLVRTDHASLIWLKNFNEPDGILARWISLLETFDFQTQHRTGFLHGNADTLSRKPRRRCKRKDCSQCSSGEDCSVNVVTATTNCDTDTDTNASATCITGSNSRSESYSVLSPFLSKLRYAYRRNRQNLFYLLVYFKFESEIAVKS